MRVLCRLRAPRDRAGCDRGYGVARAGGCCDAACTVLHEMLDAIFQAMSVRSVVRP